MVHGLSVRCGSGQTDHGLILGGIMAETFTVPELTTGDPQITIRMEAVGGHTRGRAYAHNDWKYYVRVNGTTVIKGNDLRSNATPATAAQMARTLAVFLADESEREESLSTYRPDARAFLEAEGERLGVWGAENA